MKISNKDIQQWIDEGLSWTDIFRKILESMPENERKPAWFYSRVLKFFDIRAENLSMIGAWNYWEPNGFDDDKINQRLEGKIQPKNDS